MISVCMATYNGELWIQEQLESILSQLNYDDEVILVDDASTDATLDKVRALSDSRIHIYQNKVNLGVDQTFQRALTLVRGDIIFLSDQDDIWFPNKVERITQEMERDPNITLVLSDAIIINAAGKPTGETYFGKLGRFIPGIFANIVKSKFLGCAIALRRSICNKFLPFPKKIPGHDMWIGIINEYYGKSFFIAEPLIGYRRHGKNLSPDGRQILIKMIIWRWQLVYGLINNILRCKLHEIFSIFFYRHTRVKEGSQDEE